MRGKQAKPKGTTVLSFATRTLIPVTVDTLEMRGQQRRRPKATIVLRIATATTIRACPATTIRVTVPSS